MDVSVRATVLNLMLELQQEFELSYLFVSRDLAVVERIAHRVAVMYLGQIVEMGLRRQVFENPQHSCTRRLMDAASHGRGVSYTRLRLRTPDQRRERALFPAGESPSPVWPEDEGPERVTLRDLGGGHLVAVEQQTT
ncbi:hypothetical protein AAFP32_10240 [Brevibacterium sp. CBA3109]|uniref:Uncharacterized protein n=1 Tax=Brevibacterium koreense TaxID=3140787 RepID=A0AAU7UIS5_9MICO